MIRVEESGGRKLSASHPSTSKICDCLQKNYVFLNMTKLTVFKRFSRLSEQISVKRKKKMAGEFKQYSIELFQNNSSVIHLRTIFSN